jgi:hypothetical protein
MGASPKTYGLTFVEQPNYLHARITANFVDRDLAMSFLSEIMTECANRRCKRLLLERCPPYLIVNDQFLNAADELIAMDSGTRIAFLNSQASIDESIKSNGDRGFDEAGNYSFFKSEAEAVAWLLKGSNDEISGRN